MLTIGALWKVIAPRGCRPAANWYNAATFREVFMIGRHPDIAVAPRSESLQK